jgi:anti-sigma regulatory factor (Ser/Thr protein kinase)
MSSEPSSVGPDAAVPGAEPDAGASAGDFDLVTDTSLSYVSLEVLLAELLERIRVILNADTAAILLLDRERNVLRARAARGIEEEVRQGVQIAVGRGFAGRIAAERRPIVIDDVDHADVLNPLLRQRGIRSLLGVPLLVEGRVTGVMHVGTLERRKFGEDDIRLLQLAADRAALAIDNAQLSEQRALTEIMQRILLPEALPEIPGLRFSAKYLPAAAGLKVGGDWYDVFVLDDGRVALITGDVVGRGLSAAAVMAEVRTAVRAYSMETLDPLRVVTMLNGLLLTLGGNRSATMMFMALDLETGVVEAVNAGHPPALLLHGDGRCEYVAGASGPPLGVTWSARYSAQQLSFPTGSSMLLYTDGLVERRGESIDDGLDRLATALARTPIGEHGALADAVFQRVLHEVELEDDVALLAIEALPLGDRLAFTLETRPAVLAGLRRVLGRWLAGHGLSDQEVFDVALAASEASANAIEHAYGPADATFDIECLANGGNEIVITVTDSGSWRPLGRRQRGRGLDIMGKLVDELQVQRSETGTQVRLVKRVGR